MSTEKELKKAQKEKRAIRQFNFSTLEQLKGILAAAKELKTPVILGTSEGESGFFGLAEAVAIVNAITKRDKIRAFLNLDHGKDVKLIKKAIDLGYPAVHFDGSLLPYNENLKIAKSLAAYAHKKGVVFEGELGHIAGESAPHSQKAELDRSGLTQPEIVSDFVKKTKVDSLAIAIGTSHGIYADEPALDFERLEKISRETNAFLVLHGGSGVPADQIKKAISLGIVKININTELRIAWRKSLDDSLNKNPGEVRPYKIYPPVEEAIKQKVIEKLNLFT